jgi:NitT/TauT family transport system substrate-binding protein
VKGAPPKHDRELRERPFSRAMNRSLDYARAHPDEVRRVIPTFTKTPKAAAAKLRLPVFDSKLDIEEPPDYDELRP